jgi:hypothetical protein
MRAHAVGPRISTNQTVGRLRLVSSVASIACTLAIRAMHKNLRAGSATVAVIAVVTGALQGACSGQIIPQREVTVH